MPISMMWTATRYLIQGILSTNENVKRVNLHQRIREDESKLLTEQDSALEVLNALINAIYMCTQCILIHYHSVHNYTSVIEINKSCKTLYLC